MNAEKKIAKIKAVADANEWAFYPRYSGRGMFGAECPGIVCGSYDRDDVVQAIRKAGIRDRLATDNMGLDVILYWPSILYPTEQPAETTD